MKFGADLHPDVRHAGALAIDEMSRGFIKTAADVLKAHGPDPHQPAIVASAVVMTLDVMAKQFPEVREIVAKLLVEPVPYHGAIRHGMIFKAARPSHGIDLRRVKVTGFTPPNSIAPTVWFEHEIDGVFKNVGDYLTEESFRRRFVPA